MPNAQSADGTVGKALDVLDQVAAFGRPIRFGELQSGSAYPKATLYRFVQTLTNQGILMFNPERQTYSLGVRLVRLAHAAWEQSSLAPIARAHLERLSVDTGKTVHLAQLDNAHVLYVDKVNAKSPLSMYSEAGKVGPAYCTGVGKAMMAFLDGAELSKVIAQQSFHIFTETTLAGEAALVRELVDIHAAGHAFDREEHETGIICVAAPILSQRHRMLGAVSVTSSTEHTDLGGMAELAPILKQTAAQIAEDYAAWRFPDTNQT
ncbi:MAG: IclR family transcriptional regulator [Pseudomonadota bacterium]